MQRIINILMNNKIETCQRNAFLIVWTFIYFLNQYALNASQDHMFFFSFFLKRSFNLESIGTTYLKFILSMQVMYLKIDFYWWTELLLISKFKNTTAGTPVLIWELSWLQRSVVSSSVFHTLLAMLLWGSENWKKILWVGKLYVNMRYFYWVKNF